MEISKLISIFERCIPYYQQAVDQKWGYVILSDNYMGAGLCLFVSIKFDYATLFDVMKSHYKNYMKGDYLFPSCRTLDQSQLTKLGVLPRLNFLKTEVKRLKKLQKLGYTHI